MADVAIRDSLLTARGLHGCTERDANELSEFFVSAQLIPALVVHPLAKQLNRRLRAIALFLWHVEVIDEDDGVLAKFWAIDSFTTSIHVSIDDILGLIGRGLGREGQAQERPIFVLEVIIQLAHNRDTFAGTGRSTKQSVLLVGQQLLEDAVCADRVDRGYDDFSVGCSNRNLIDCLRLHPVNPSNLINNKA